MGLRTSTMKVVRLRTGWRGWMAKQAGTAFIRPKNVVRNRRNRTTYATKRSCIGSFVGISVSLRLDLDKQCN